MGPRDRRFRGQVRDGGLAESYADGAHRYMSEESFIGAIAPTEDFIKIGKRQYGLLYKVASKGKGKVTADDYVAFQRLLKEPDAEFRVAFSVFDLDGNGSLGLDEFKKVFSESLGPRSLPFNFDTPWLKMYMGKAEGDHVVGYTWVCCALGGAVTVPAANLPNS
jgi:solute carrier family 25 aspartate/glutamate transporter 12/13